MTTKTFYEVIKNVKFKMYIPNYRIGFIVKEKEYNSGAFGVVILKLEETFDIKLLTKKEMENEEWKKKLF